jgi:dCMP deaminase
MQKPAFDDIFMQLAQNIALRSHCVRKKVGAVLAKDTRIVSIGYNGPPAGTYNCDEKWPVIGCPEQLKGGCSLAIHAEQNAIIYAIKQSIALQGATLYITLSPCLPCARIVYSMGISKVIYENSYAEYKSIEYDEGLNFLKQFGVETLKYTNSTL